MPRLRGGGTLRDLAPVVHLGRISGKLFGDVTSLTTQANGTALGQQRPKNGVFPALFFRLPFLPRHFQVAPDAQDIDIRRRPRMAGHSGDEPAQWLEASTNSSHRASRRPSTGVASAHLAVRARQCPLHGEHAKCTHHHELPIRTCPPTLPYLTAGHSFPEA